MAAQLFASCRLHRAAHRLDRRRAGGRPERATARLRTAAPQVDVLRREVGRLTAESSQLRGELLREADACAALERGHYQAVKALEAQLAAAQLARETAAARLAALERENEGLRQKANSLLSIGQQRMLGVRAGRTGPAVDVGGARGQHWRPLPAELRGGALSRDESFAVLVRCRRWSGGAAVKDHHLKAAGWVGSCWRWLACGAVVRAARQLGGGLIALQGCPLAAASHQQGGSP